jgi:EAL domain-containing protein (putative c-di-GMP-specific phosphodiesterase class I)/ActR/RegA family two-component response regulator
MARGPQRIDEPAGGGPAARPARPRSPPGAVLVVDPDPAGLQACAKDLALAGFEVACTGSAEAVARLLGARRFDAVVADAGGDGTAGLAILQKARERDPDLPVILVTGAAQITTAVRAVELGAYRYLVRPVGGEALAVAVAEAVAACAEARAVAERADCPRPPPPGLSERFTRALGNRWIAQQPIVRWSDRSVYGYEGLLRSAEPRMVRPDEILLAARVLGRLPELGRVVRESVAASAEEAPPGASLFVNVHPWDLHAEDLTDPRAPLARIAPRVVLEITERSSLSDVLGLRDRVAALRRAGYRIAVDDLGAGYAGLAWIAELEPDLVKLDRSFVRGIQLDPARTRLVRAMVGLCRELGIQTVAEGVEEAGERDALVGAGCDLLQGWLFGRPGRGFPAPRF